MRKIYVLLALVASLFAVPAYADFTGKDAAAATITFKNPGTCSSVVCVPVFQIYDGTNVVTLTTVGADAVSNTLTGVPMYGRNLVFNGTTWDRWMGDLTNGAWVNVKASVLPTGAAISATQGATTDAPAAVPTSATAATEIALLKALTNVANSATPAGELHIGEIASNQIKVQVAQTVTASSAYASGNAIGGLMTVAGAARVSGALGAAGTGGIVAGLTMNSKSLQTTQVDIFLFDANPAGSTCTDKTAFSLATADFDKVIGVITIPGTPANGAGWYAGTVGSTGVATYYPATYDLSSATSIFACAVTRGTPTYTATTDVSFKFNILRN